MCLRTIEEGSAAAPLEVYIEEPEQGEWIRFERDLHADFEKFYGDVPEGFSSIRILYEVRYDGRNLASDPEAGARVWYDDLYLGP